MVATDGGRDGGLRRRLVVVSAVIVMISVDMRLQMMQVVDGALCVGGGSEDRPPVATENLEPAGEIARMIRAWLKFRDDTEIGAEEAAAEFGNQLLAGAFAPVLCIAAEVAIEPVWRCRPMRHLVTEYCDIGSIIRERIEGWHLDIVAGLMAHRLVILNAVINRAMRRQFSRCANAKRDALWMTEYLLPPPHSA
ncbi:hypothetical protein EV286_1174 [Rhizobium sp. BK251]|nr:hypothetical protein EV286_1174 [Rhizobium sp. BK251]